MITGAAGGIGSTLALELTKKGHKVIAIDNLANGYTDNLIENNKRFCTFLERDIRDDISIPYTLDKEKIDTVIHLAAITSLPSAESDPKECIDVNVAGTAAILDAVRKSKGQRVIIASTSAIYENTNKIYAPFFEDAPVTPKLMYPLSKKMMEDVIEAYKINYDMDIVTLRFFNVFGPRQDIHRPSPPLLNYIARCVHKKEQCVFYSNGEQVRDYVHVNDVTELIELCMTVPEARGEIFNVCTGTLTSVKDIISYAEKAFGHEIEHIFKPSTDYWSGYKDIHKGPKPLLPKVIDKEVNKYALGTFFKAKKILGWNPNTDIEKLMIETFKQIEL
jgi:nucleoside-diphosphate-sugar epimerase